MKRLNSYYLLSFLLAMISVFSVDSTFSFENSQDIYAQSLPSSSSLQDRPFTRWSSIDLPTQWKEEYRQTAQTAFHWQKKSQSLDSPFKELAQFKSALEWFRQGDYFKASHLFESLPTTPFQEIQLFFWAEALFHQGRYQESRDQLRRLHLLHPYSVHDHDQHHPA